jgi:DNA-binding response OmpR family regulator
MKPEIVPTSPPQPSSRGSGTTNAAKRILIVDDEPNILRSLEFLMTRSGFSVELAQNGREGLAALERDPPDLLLLDVMMPELDGYGVCQRVRQDPRWNATKIVMLTARGREEERAKGLALGADDYVTKPFSTRVLVEHVKTLLGVA